MGLRNALNVMTLISTIVHASSDSPDVQHLNDALERGGLRAYLEERDGPFHPEPGGPRSAKSD